MGMIYLFSHTPKKGVKHIKIIDIDFLRPEKFDDFDTIIFTSKNGVKALDLLCIEWKKIPCYVIGSPTAQEVIKYGGRVEYVGKNSHADEFAKEIKPLLMDKKILFPRAKKVVTNIKKILSPINLQEVIVYGTKCSEKEFEKPPFKSTLIFTSPSCVECFLKKFDMDESYKIICIGKKTALALPENIPYKMPPIQTIDSCIKLAKFINN